MRALARIVLPGLVVPFPRPHGGRPATANGSSCVDRRNA